MTPVTTVCCGSNIWTSCRNSLARHRVKHHAVLDQAVEQLAARPRGLTIEKIRVGNGYVFDGIKPQDAPQKRASGFALLDVLENMYEWVNNWYDPDYYQNSV